MGTPDQPHGTQPAPSRSRDRAVVPPLKACRPQKQGVLLARAVPTLQECELPMHSEVQFNHISGSMGCLAATLDTFKRTEVEPHLPPAQLCPCHVQGSLLLNVSEAIKCGLRLCSKFTWL